MYWYVYQNEIKKKTKIWEYRKCDVRRKNNDVVYDEIID